jgi:excisionase family DNA binding protein
MLGAPVQKIPEPLLTIADIVKISGISESVVHRELKDGNLRSYKFGRSVRIDPADYQAWLDSKRQRPHIGGRRCAALGPAQ